MQFLPDLGQGPNTAVPIFVPETPLPQGWSLSLDLRSGFASSTLVVVVDVAMLYRLKVESVRHSVKLPMVERVLAAGNNVPYTQTIERFFSGFVLADIAILHDTYALQYQQLLAGEMAANVRRTSINNDATFADVLVNIDRHLGASRRTIGKHPIALKFHDLRWWWRTYGASYNSYNDSIGQVTRVPSGVRNLLIETPTFDPSFDKNRSDNPPETYPGQHDPEVFALRTDTEKAVIEGARKEARTFGGGLANTDQLNTRPVEAQRPQTDEGKRHLTWKEVLGNLLLDIGAAWKRVANGLDNDLYTLIDPTGFQAPLAPTGPPPITPTGGNAWSQLVQFLHGTGHTLEPLLDGTFKIVEVAIDDATRTANVDYSNNTLDRILLYSSRSEQEKPSRYALLPQIPIGPLPYAIKVSYEPVPGEGQWRRLGRNIVSRGDHLPHVLISTQWLLNRIHKSPYPLPVLKLASAAFSSRNGNDPNDELAFQNASLPRLPYAPNRAVKDIFAPISPAQPIVSATQGDDLSKPKFGNTNGDQLLNYGWGPYGTGSDTPIAVKYANPQVVDTPYDHPSWILYPRTKAPLGVGPLVNTFTQALPQGLFPLMKFAQQQLLADLIPNQTIVFPFHPYLLPDRFVQGVRYTYGNDRSTTCLLGVPSLPENAWPRPPRIDPPQTLFLQATGRIEKNLTELKIVKAVYPAQTQDATDAWISGENTAALTRAFPTLDPGVRPTKATTSNPTGGQPAKNSQPYWRVERAELVIENLSGRDIRPDELFVAHRGPTDNYQILPNSGTTLAIAKALNNFSSSDPTYRAAIVRDFRTTRIHAADPDKETFTEEPFLVEEVLVVNSQARSGKVDDRALVALAGQIEPWPNADNLEYGDVVLSRPLGEASLTSVEVWEELTVPTSTDNARFGILATSTDAEWDNEANAMKTEIINVWPFFVLSGLPLFNREASYSPQDRINLAAEEYDPTRAYLRYELTLYEGKVYFAKADRDAEDWTVAHWTLCGDPGPYRADTNITGPKNFTPSDWVFIDGGDRLEFIDREAPTVPLIHRFTNLDLEEGQLVAYLKDQVIGITCKPVEGWE